MRIVVVFVCHLFRVRFAVKNISLLYLLSKSISTFLGAQSFKSDPAIPQGRQMIKQPTLCLLLEPEAAGIRGGRRGNIQYLRMAEQDTRKIPYQQIALMTPIKH